MDIHPNHLPNSPTSSTSSTTTTTTNTNNHTPRNPANVAVAAATSDDPMHSWWESVSRARSRIHSLSSVLPPPASAVLSSLADSDRPALSLLSSAEAYSLVSSSLASQTSGSGADPLCQWLYDTFLSGDSHLRLVVLAFLPLLSGLYLSRVHSDPSRSLAGFEAVLLALYSSEVKARAGKPLLVNVPDLSQPSLYHTPRQQPSRPSSVAHPRSSTGVLCPPLEPQIAVKSTKRACIVGVALDCYYRQISQMPAWSKIELCRFASAWAGQDCPCKTQFDDGNKIENQNRLSVSRVLEYDDEEGYENEIRGVSEEMGSLRIENGDGCPETSSETIKGSRITLPWELLQPTLRILGHCLLGPLNSQEVRDAASAAVRSLYARASHDLNPQAILATRSLIQLDKTARDAAKVAAAAAAATNASSNANTPTKAKKPEVLLVSK